MINLTMMKRKSFVGSVNEYRNVMQVSQDRIAPVAGTYRDANILDARIIVSRASTSWSSVQASFAQGKIMKPRSWVEATVEF